MPIIEDGTTTHVQKTISIYSNDGTSLLYSNGDWYTGYNIEVTETGLAHTEGFSTSYDHEKSILGFATSANATEPTYAVGDTFQISADTTLYVIEAKSSGVTVEYNSSVIATIPSGNKATIPVADKKMKTDIIITVSESSSEVLPEFTEVEDFTVFVESEDEGELTIGYSVSQDVKLPNGTHRLGVIAYEGEEPNLISKTITENGTYKASEEVQDELEGTWLLDGDFVKVNDDEKSLDYIVNGYYNGLNLANNFEEGLKFKKLTIAHWIISGESKVNFNIYSELQYISTDLGFEEYVDVTQTYYSRYSNVGDIVVNNGGTNYISPDSENGLKMRTITITSKLSEVENGDLLLAWLKVNATKQPAPAIDGYSEVVVNVEATDSPLPIEVSTEAEMTALLTSGEVGGVYKYTGTTGTYENGALYVLEVELGTFTYTQTGGWYSTPIVRQFPLGMTWAEFISSEYNAIAQDGEGDYAVVGQFIIRDDGQVMFSGDNVNSTNALTLAVYYDLSTTLVYGADVILDEGIYDSTFNSGGGGSV